MSETPNAETVPTPRYVTLAFHDGDGVAVYGDFDTRADARLVCERLTDTVTAMRVVALHSPESGTWPVVGDVVSLPDEVAGALSATPVLPEDSVAGRAVVIVDIPDDSGRLAVVVGPFDTPKAAGAWCTRVQVSWGGHGRRGLLLLLPLVTAPMRHAEQPATLYT